MRKLFFATCALLSFALTKANAQAVTLYVGVGGAGCSGDGGPATSSELFYPINIAVDAAGNLYISDTGCVSIRKVNGGTQIISTITGDGTWGFSGDGGPATAAQIHRPMGLASDGTGNLYFCDFANNRIRKIDAAGNISTIAGTGALSSTGNGGPATNATLAYPTGIACRNGNVYVVESYNRVRKIDAAGMISGVAGNGAVGPRLDGVPATSTPVTCIGIAVDNIGNIFLADNQDNRVRKIDTFGIITTYAGSTTGVSGYAGDGGPATAALLWAVNSVDFDPAQNLYIADYSLHIRKVTPGGIISTVPTTGISYAGEVRADYLGNLYVLSCASQQIWHITIPTSPPSFPGGATQNLSVCESSGANSINALLAVDDLSPGRTLTWTAISGPSHGTLAASYVTTSTGFTITPTGLTYTPTIGYTGPDAFTEQVTDGTTTVTTTVNITVSAGPVVSAISGTPTVCAGSSVSLSNSAAGGTWTSSNTNATVTSAGIVTGNAAGTTIISYTLAVACGTTAADYTVTVNPSPATGSITGPASVCVGSTISLAATASGGTWSSSGAFASVSASGVVAGVAGGTEVITYSVSNSCGTAIATHTVTSSASPDAGSITGSSSVCVGSSITLSENITGGTWSSSGVFASVTATGVVTGVAAGTETITYTATNGCGTASVTANISVGVGPSAGSISGSSTVCAGATVTLSETIAGGSWSVSNANATISGTGVVTGVTAGSVTVSYTIVAACGTVSASYPMTIADIPSAGTITGADTVCVGNTISLSDAVPGGAWSVSNTKASVAGGVVTGITTGKDTVVYTVTNTCGTASARHPIYIRPAAGCTSGEVPVNFIATELNVYPNPNTGTFTLSMASNTDEEAQIMITNILGAKVKEFIVTTNHITDVQLNTPGGVYFISAHTATGYYYKKVIVNR